MERDHCSILTVSLRDFLSQLKLECCCFFVFYFIACKTISMVKDIAETQNKYKTNKNESLYLYLLVSHNV